MRKLSPGFIISTSLLLIALFSSIAFFAYRNKQSGSNFTVRLQTNTAQQSLTDVYLVDTTSHAEKMLATMPNVYRDHYHAAEFYNGSLYIVLKSHCDSDLDSTCTHELWKYSTSGEATKTGTRLYSTKGLDFRTNPEGHQLVIIYRLDSEKALSFIDENGAVLKSFTRKDLGIGENLAIEPGDWSNNNLTLKTKEGNVTRDSISIDTRIYTLR